jgi:alkylhydroperoxidase family enzyme
MLTWLMRRRIAAFERTYDYDVSYLRLILEASPRAFLAFGKLGALAQYRRGVPLDAYFAAKLVAARAEDCGPCTQLAVTMAERAGVAPGVLAAVFARDEAAMTPEAALGFRFAEAVLAHAPRADDLRVEIVQRWGRQAIVSLAFTIAASRVFPTVKYALGYGKACTRVTIAGAAVPILRNVA